MVELLQATHHPIALALAIVVTIEYRGWVKADRILRGFVESLERES